MTPSASPVFALMALMVLTALPQHAQAAVTVSSGEGLVTGVDVDASIEHRYVVTRVATRMLNPLLEERQVLLQMTLPKGALVSSFVMELGGANYSAVVSENQAARRTYEAARLEGKTAGILELRDNDLQKLQVRASVPGQGQVVFHVTYEELLHRSQGSYIYTVLINPGMRVPKAKVRVRVLEREAITDYKVLELPGQEMKVNNPGTSVTGGPVTDGELHVLYEHQDPEEGDGRGVEGAFTLSYDITNHTDGGEVQRVGSYFAHFFSPERLPKIASHTVFLLDVSLSMYNGKLDSMKEALQGIIRGMEEGDTFEILAFSSDVVSLGVYCGGDEEGMKRAVRRVRRLVSLGYSNLNAALLEALKAVNEGGSDKAVKQVVVLSDGHATTGIRLPEVVCANVKQANTHHLPIFVFIFNAKSRILEDISKDSGGFARYLHHYNHYHFDHNSPTAAAEQIAEFYKAISEPLMGDVEITYPVDEVDPSNVVRSGMPNYYSGGEIVMVGRLRPGVHQVRPRITARGREGPLQLSASRMDSRDPFLASVRENHITRIWAYLLLQELLAKAAVAEHSNSTQELEAKALEIAMKFNFVSPLTSLVVVYPAEHHLLLSLPAPAPVPVPIPAPQPHPLPSPVGNTQPAFTTTTQADGGARLGRSTYVDLDPHFLVHTPSLDLPLCFNYQGKAGVNVRLLHDPQSGIIINGHVASVRQRPNIKFFSRLFLRLGPVNLTVTPEELKVDCLGDDGSPQVDTVVKSLWPFYKTNGRKYKRHAYKMKRNKAAGARRRKADHKHHLDRQYHNNNNNNYHHINEVTAPNTHTHSHGYAHTHAHGHAHAHNIPHAQTDDRGSVKELRRGRGRQRNMRRRQSSNRNSGGSGHGGGGGGGSSKDCSVNTSWEEGLGRIYGNVMVVLSRKRSLDITIGDGLAHFTIRRSRIRRGQRFLGFYIKDQEIFSPQTHGMMGQFISKRVRRMASDRSSEIQTRNVDNTSGNGSPERITLEVARPGPRKMSRVSGVVGSRYSLMGKTRVKCIQVQAKGAEGVLDGQPRDYLIQCLHC